MRSIVTLFANFPLILLLAASGAAQQQPPPQAAGGVAAGEPKFKVQRVVSGSKGSRKDGRYMIEDPRTVFYVPDDKQVIVYFEWEGPLGAHRFEGIWKNPQGKVSVISEFEYNADQKRYGGYWTLFLGPETEPGLWTLEARVDGEMTGTHKFQVIAASTPEGAIPSARPMLPAQTIYNRLLAVSILIEKLNVAGEVIGTGTGFHVGEGIVLTAFQVIDGASALRVALSDGKRFDVRDVVSWDRWKDWAYLKTDAGALPRLERAKDGVWSIGDRCFALEVRTQGGRLIVDGNILGKHDFPTAGLRMNLSFALSSAANGSPLVNDYGEVVAIVGGSLLPGEALLGEFRYGYSSDFPGGGDSWRGALATPINVIPLHQPEKQPTPLEEMMRTGQFTPPLASRRWLHSGALARSVVRQYGMPLPNDEKRVFSRREGQMSVFVHWDPKEKRKALATVRIYDLENRKIGEGKPLKIDLKPAETKFAEWTIRIEGIPAGTYRLDVVLGEDVVWRCFFRITD